MEFRVIIPARFHSTRFPGKLLKNIAGKSMLQHVYEHSVASGAESVVIATGDQNIAETAEKFGATVCLTQEDHSSGIERLSEAVTALDYDEKEIVVCVQGDKPLISPQVIRSLAEDLVMHDNVKVASICDVIDNPKDLFDPNIIKVVMNWRNYALYFTRAPIPWEVDNFQDRENIKLSGNHYRHLGLYAFRVGFLKDYMEWSPSNLETLESLEQLRILWNGGRIHMRISKDKLPPSVNTEEDLLKVLELIKSKK